MITQKPALVHSKKSRAQKAQPGKVASRCPEAIVGRDRLTWRREGGRLSLYYRLDRSPLAGIAPDLKYPKLFRIRFPGGELSDIVNLSRAKDAAIAAALHHLNSTLQETGVPSRPVRERRSAVGWVRRAESRLPGHPSKVLAGSHQ